jgi:hypothetical protein
MQWKTLVYESAPRPVPVQASFSCRSALPVFSRLTWRFAEASTQTGAYVLPLILGTDLSGVTTPSCGRS